MAGKLDQTAAKLNTDDSGPPNSWGVGMSPTTLRVLKILVVVMGILIVAGVVTIVATIISRLNAKSEASAPSQSRLQAPNPVTMPVMAPAVIDPIGTVTHALPTGARIVSVSADAGRLFIHHQGAETGAGVLILDGATGQVLGELRFDPAQ